MRIMRALPAAAVLSTLLMVGAVLIAHASATHRGTAAVAWSQEAGGATVFPACGSAGASGTCVGSSGQVYLDWDFSPGGGGTTQIIITNPYGQSFDIGSGFPISGSGNVGAPAVSDPGNYSFSIVPSYYAGSDPSGGVSGGFAVPNCAPPPPPPPPTLAISQQEITPGPGATVRRGDSILYRLYFIAGGSDQNWMDIHDYLPSYTSLAWQGGGTEYNSGGLAGGAVWWQQQYAPAGFSGYTDFVVTVNGDAPHGAQICNAGLISSHEVGQQGSNTICNTVNACASNQGASCSSGGNACGQINTGTIQCDGSCSASPPANPSGYGSLCNSSPNSCGAINTGTIQCNGSCSASPPANPSSYGNSCASTANACGSINTGTIQCNGSCSASTPANPSGYGSSCTSSANACGSTNTGTIQCSGSCSASPPANPSGYGSACTSAANTCGQVNTGTIQCNGACSATTPNNPTGYGSVCQSPPNQCGATTPGTIECNGACSATTAPPNSSCGKPDLTAGPISPSTATVNQATTLSATIVNSTKKTGSGFTDLFEINPGSIPNLFSDIQALRTFASGELAADTSNTASASYTFSSVGTWYLRACADLNTSNVGSINESNENNNCGPWTIFTVTTNCVSNEGASCTSSANSCGQTNTGVVQCNGSCSATAPPNSSCPPTASLNTNPDTVYTGHACTLFWSSTNATSCTGAGFSTGGATGNPAGGVSTGNLTQTATYQITCAGSGGTSAPVQATCTILQPEVQITSDQPRVVGGGSITIAWNATHTGSCTISGPNLSSTAVSGSQTISNITQQSVYTISCQNPATGGTLSKSVTVNITSQFKEF